MLSQLISFAKEIEELLESQNLREIAQYSFQQREAKRNVPYLMIADTEKDWKDARKTICTRLHAAPTQAQKELKKFFSEVAPAHKGFPRYTFDVYEHYVDFKECIGKDADGKKIFVDLTEAGKRRHYKRFNLYSDRK